MDPHSSQILAGPLTASHVPEPSTSFSWPKDYGSSEHRRKLTLLGLPGEILNQIYRYLLCGHVIQMRQSKPSSQPKPPLSATHDGPHLSILQVCKRTLQEGRSFLYGENTLLYAHYRIQGTPFNLHFPPKCLPLVKRIHIFVMSFSDWNGESADQKEVADMLLQFAVPGVELEYMKIALHLKGPREDPPPGPHPPRARQQVITTKSSIAVALLSLTSVQKIIIEVAERANIQKGCYNKLSRGLKLNGGLPRRLIEIWDHRSKHNKRGPTYTLLG